MIPNFWLKRPEFELTDERLKQFENAYQKILGSEFDQQDVTAPIWVFLLWLAEHKPLLLHGSINPGISIFEPRTPNDRSPDAFSKQTAVFATSDGLWSMFYAIVDRKNHRLRMLNAAQQFKLEQGWTEMRYFFSITEPAYSKFPFCKGAVYVLPKEGFIEQPISRFAEYFVKEPQWVNPEAVVPLSKIHVRPEDFPFLALIRSHDENEVEKRSQADPYGFPWL